MKPLANSNVAIDPAIPMRWVNPLELARWDELLATHPDATIFHSAPWARVLANTYKFKPHYLAVADSLRLWGLVPVFEVDSWLTGKRGVSLPFTDYCEPLASSAAPAEGLFEQAIDMGKARGWKYLEMRGEIGNAAAREPALSFYEHSLELSVAEEELLQGMDSSVRRAIRKAQAAGVRVEVADTVEGMEQYFELHCLTRKKHGLPPQPIRFFEEILRGLIQKGLGTLLLAYFEGKPIAGLVLLRFAKKAVYKFGGSNPRFDSLRPNNLLMWEAIRLLARNGYETLSFGRTSFSNAGLRRYKLNWGAREQVLSYYKFNLGNSSFETEKDRAAGAHNLFFRHCPAPVGRALGRLLYPHIA